MNKRIKPRRFPSALTLVGTALWALAHAVSAESNVTFVPASRVRVTDAFWKPLLDRNRALTIPHNLRMCREVGIVANFARVAGLRDGDYHGGRVLGLALPGDTVFAPRRREDLLGGAYVLEGLAARPAN